MKQSITSIIPKHRKYWIFGAISALAALFSGLSANYLFPGDKLTILWACVFGIFIVFHRFGHSKNIQVYNILLSGLLAIIAIATTAYVALLPTPFNYIALSILIFLSLCVHRYVKGDRIWSIFMVVYAVLFFYCYPGLTAARIPDTLLRVFSCLGIALFFTCIFTYILPLAAEHVMPANKSPKLIKRALRTTILLNIAFMIGHFTSGRDVAWIAFSILVVSEENLEYSIKKSFNRAIGTVLGAIIGIVGAHHLFEFSPIATIAICFILIFLTYSVYKHNYAVGICLATILVSASYYLYNIPITYNQFVMARILDTLIGVSIGLAGEFVIFPELNKKQSGEA